MTVAKRACHGAVREGDHNVVLNFVPTCDHIMCARKGGARLTHDRLDSGLTRREYE